MRLDILDLKLKTGGTVGGGFGTAFAPKRHGLCVANRKGGARRDDFGKYRRQPVGRGLRDHFIKRDHLFEIARDQAG